MSDIFYTLNRNEIVPFKHAGKFAWISLRDISGFFQKPEGGALCWKIENPPANQFRLRGNFNDVYTFETLLEIIRHTDDMSNDINKEMANSFKKVISTPLQFINNVRPFGITVLSEMLDYAKQSPAMDMPVMISGMCADNYNDPTNDDALKVPYNMFLHDVGRDLTRTNIFILLDNNFCFKFLMTKYFSCEDWLDSIQGQEHCKNKKYIAHIRIGYTIDTRANSLPFSKTFSGDYRIHNFIYKPYTNEWTIYLIKKKEETEDNKSTEIYKLFQLTGGLWSNIERNAPLKTVIKELNCEYKRFTPLYTTRLEYYTQ